jgi:hypothetical protein
MASSCDVLRIFLKVDAESTNGMRGWPCHSHRADMVGSGLETWCKWVLLARYI